MGDSVGSTVGAAETATVRFSLKSAPISSMEQTISTSSTKRLSTFCQIKEASPCAATQTS